MRSVTAKLGRMRTYRNFTVYPVCPDGTIIVQSDNVIGQFDPLTRRGLLNSKGPSTKFFVHLTYCLGAVDFEFPADFVAECVKAGEST
jgi:hypothetical protein